MSHEIQNPSSPPLPPDEATLRLIRMLNSVRLEKQELGRDEQKKEGCPNCGSIQPWGALSSCPQCSYNPQLGRVTTSAETADVRRGKKSAVHWSIWLLVGLFLILSLSLASFLIVTNAETRASYGRIQFLIGIVLIFMGQVRAFVLINRSSSTLPMSSIFFEPVQLWKTALQRLPESRRSLYCGGWGLTAIILAIVLVGTNFQGMFGGIQTVFARKFQQQAGAYSHTLQYVRSEYFSPEPLAVPASEEELSADVNADAALNSQAEAAGVPLLSSTDDKLQIPQTAKGEDRDHLADLVIFGYLTNPQGELKSVLLAEIGSRGGRFAGRLALDETDKRSRQILQMTLDRIRSPRSALQTSYRGRWVRPIVIARVASTGRSAQGLIENGYLVGIDQRNVEKFQNTIQAGRP